MRRYVDYCFYGLLLIFLDFNLYSQVGYIDVLSDALGIWLLAYGLYGLQRVNQRLHRAFQWSLLYLLADVFWEVSTWAGWLKFYPLLGGAMTVMVTGLMLLTFYELLGGLSGEACRSDLAELGDELERWRGYMIVVFLAGAFVLLIPLVILQLAWVIFWLLLFLQLGYLIHQCSKKLPRELVNRPQESALWTLLPILTLGLALGAAASVVCNLPQTIEVPYTAVAEQEAPEVVALRQQLLELGLPRQVVNDFDAEEINHYQGVWKVLGERTHAAGQNVDDTTVLLERYVCYLPDGQARYIGAYRYLKSPKHAYSGELLLYYHDVNGVRGYSFRLGEPEAAQSLQLFRRGETIYRTLPLGEDNIRQGYTGMMLEFGLPRNGEDIRGYLLVDCQVDWEAPQPTWLALEYWQQTKLLHGVFDGMGEHHQLISPPGYERGPWLAYEEIYHLAYPDVANY